MKAGRAGWLLVSVSLLGSLLLSCSGSSDDAPAGAGAGAPSGGATSAASGASAGGKSNAGVSGSAGNLGSAGSAGPAVDCTAVCGHVKALCVDNSAISDVWLDACKTACEARVQVAPDIARLEQTCVSAAADCSASIVCVASPH